MKYIKIIPVLSLLFISLACNFLTSTPPVVSTQASPQISVSTPPTLIVPPIQEETDPTLITPPIQEETDPTLIHQWADRSRLEPGYLDDIAVGAPEGDIPCG